MVLPTILYFSLIHTQEKQRNFIKNYQLYKMNKGRWAEMVELL